MKNKILFVFLILLFSLVFASFIYSIYSPCNSNYNSSYLYEGYTNAEVDAVIYYDPLGNSARIVDNKVVIVDVNGVSVDYIYDETKKYYIAPNGAYAIITTGPQGNKVIKLVDINNNITYFVVKTDKNYVANYDHYNHYNGVNNPVVFYGPNGEVAKVINTNNDGTIVITHNDGKTDIYYIDKNNTDVNANIYYGPNGANAKIIITDDGRKAIEITGPNGNKVVYYDNNMNINKPIDRTLYDVEPGLNDLDSVHNVDVNKYYSSLPKGIPRSQIPPGDEDLYILKSQVVPPVCPKCPQPIYNCNNENKDNIKCPPCPPCARCPEPNFTCQKVPNYSSFNQENIPIPVLNDFSSFGM